MQRRSAIFLLLIAFVASCQSEKDKRQQDIEIHQFFFEENASTFGVIEKKFDSAMRSGNFTENQLSAEVNEGIAQLKLSGEKMTWHAKIDTLSNRYLTYRIHTDIPGLSSRCAVFNYIYVISMGYLSKIAAAQKNITYQMLNPKWFLEIDDSKPCDE